MEYVTKAPDGNFARCEVPDSYVYEQVEALGMSTKEACEKWASLNGCGLCAKPKGTSKDDVLGVLRDALGRAFGTDVEDVGRQALAFRAGKDSYEVRLVKKR